MTRYYYCVKCNKESNKRCCIDCKSNEDCKSHFCVKCGKETDLNKCTQCKAKTQRFCPVCNKFIYDCAHTKFPTTYMGDRYCSVCEKAVKSCKQHPKSVKTWSENRGKYLSNVIPDSMDKMLNECRDEKKHLSNLINRLQDELEQSHADNKRLQDELDQLRRTEPKQLPTKRKRGRPKKTTTTTTENNLQYPTLAELGNDQHEIISPSSNAMNMFEIESFG